MKFIIFASLFGISLAQVIIHPAPRSLDGDQDDDYLEPVRVQPRDRISPDPSVVHVQPHDEDYIEPVHVQPRDEDYIEPVHVQPRDEDYIQPVHVQPRDANDEEITPVRVQPRIGGDSALRAGPRGKPAQSPAKKFFYYYAPPQPVWHKVIFDRLYQYHLLQSSNYPSGYGSNDDIRYVYESPVGSTITIDCTDFNINATNSCAHDALCLSRSGDTDDSRFNTACGKGTLTMTSESNRFAVKFFSALNRLPHVFRYSCKVYAIPASEPSTTTATTTTTAPTTTRTTTTASTTRSTTASTTAKATAATTTTAATSKTCTCGARKQAARIVNGVTAGVNEFPWRCGLRVKKGNRDQGIICGSTLISENYALTAAHCCAAFDATVDSVTVDCGEHNTTTRTESQNVPIRVDRQITHPGYTDNYNQEHDMCLLHLSTPMPITKEISPVCLPFNNCGNDCKTDTPVVASGWGVNRSGSNSAMEVLQKVDLNCISTEKCSSYYRGYITNNMVCTYTQGKDTCQGDSGGSIDTKGPNGDYCLVGVVSWGDGCAGLNKPGVYVKASNYLTWIKQTTGETFCGE